METAPTATSELAVLFADVSGSTRLYEALGDQRALATIAPLPGSRQGRLRRTRRARDQDDRRRGDGRFPGGRQRRAGGGGDAGAHQRRTRHRDASARDPRRIPLRSGAARGWRCLRRFGQRGRAARRCRAWRAGDHVGGNRVGALAMAAGAHARADGAHRQGQASRHERIRVDLAGFGRRPDDAFDPRDHADRAIARAPWRPRNRAG